MLKAVWVEDTPLRITDEQRRIILGNGGHEEQYSKQQTKDKPSGGYKKN